MEILTNTFRCYQVGKHHRLEQQNIDQNDTKKDQDFYADANLYASWHYADWLHISETVCSRNVYHIEYNTDL